MDKTFFWDMTDLYKVHLLYSVFFKCCLIKILIAKLYRRLIKRIILNQPPTPITYFQTSLNVLLYLELNSSFTAGLGPNVQKIL